MHLCLTRKKQLVVHTSQMSCHSSWDTGQIQMELLQRPTRNGAWCAGNFVGVLLAMLADGMSAGTI